MASSMLTENTLVLSYQIGVNDEGKDVFKQQNFKRVSSLATEEELLDLADLVGGVIDFSVSEVKKEQTFILARI
mgnify:FL=1